MLSSLRTLAAAADGLSAHGQATVTETPTALTVAALAASDAAELWPLFDAVGWPFDAVDSAGERANFEGLTSDYEPFIITMEKPAQESVLQVITREGLTALLLEERSDEVWHVATLEAEFSTMSANFLPWGATGVFSPAPMTKSPRELVRDHRIPPHAPADVRVWMLRAAASEKIWNSAAFQTFADLSAQALMRALAGEIKIDGSLVFRGPPYTELDAPRPGSASDLKRDGYNELREAASWVYENGVEAEQRHGLFVAEMGASHPPIATSSLAFRQVVKNALQGAKLSYQLSLSDLTREAIKAQGELRKAVADDTAKLAENTRQVATAVAVALATCVGLIATRIGSSTPGWAIQLVALVAALYVGAVIVSGWLFMGVQQDMRRKWRSRLYRFIPEPDYKAMVTEPANRSESMFKVAAFAGAVVAALAVVLVLFFA